MIPAAAVAPILAALIAALAMLWQTRINSRATTQTSLDVRAQDTLELALASQERQITALTVRVDAQARKIGYLEQEVEACEVGRRDDRAAWASEVAELQAEIRSGHSD